MARAIVGEEYRYPHSLWEWIVVGVIPNSVGCHAAAPGKTEHLHCDVRKPGGQIDHGYWHNGVDPIADMGATRIVAAAQPFIPHPASPPPAPFPTYKIVLDWDDAKPAPAKPAKPLQRWVSHNGKDWCRYELLLDADPFEDWKHRKEGDRP